jgi:hypothetical protein
MEQVLNDLWGGVKDSHMPNGKKCGISEETYIRIHESQFIGYWPYKHIKSSTISPQIPLLSQTSKMSLKQLHGKFFLVIRIQVPKNKQINKNIHLALAFS